MLGWLVTQFGDIRENVSKLAQNQTLWYFSQKSLTIFLVFGLKLVLNITFNLNETYFSEKFAIWRYLTSKSSKNCPIKDFGHFLDFALLVFLDFAHNDRWAWCLVVFLQFAGPVNVFLFFFWVWISCFWIIQKLQILLAIFFFVFFFITSKDFFET